MSVRTMTWRGWYACGILLLSGLVGEALGPESISHEGVLLLVVAAFVVFGCAPDEDRP